MKVKVVAEGQEGYSFFYNLSRFAFTPDIDYLIGPG